MAWGLSYDPTQIQSIVSVVFYMVIGLILAAIFAYMLYKLYQNLTYPYHITFHEKVGKAVISFEDKAKEVQEDDNFYFHYKGINKMSDMWHPKFQTIVRRRTFLGLMKQNFKGYNLYKEGKKIVPMVVATNSIEPFDMDNFNFVQSQVKTIIRKYTKQHMLVQLAPIIGVGLVVMMFIIGMIFYTKHIETISQNILSTASAKATEILQYAGVQNIPAK